MNLSITNIPVKIGIILLIYFFLIFILDFFFKKAEQKQKDIHTQFILKLLRVTMSILCLGIIGFQFAATKELTKALLTCSSLFIAVAGFAAQQTLADVIAGFMISWSKPYNINERITLVNSGITGIVEGISMRHTVIKLFDNNRLIIPNSVMNKEIIKNSNYEDSKIGNFLEIEVSYASVLDTAIELIKESLYEHPLVVDKEEISVMVKDFTANGIILKTTVWTKDVNDNFQACSDIRKDILKRFYDNDIDIPYQHIVLIQDSLKNN